MGHPWNVFKVCTERIYRYKNSQLTNSLQNSTLDPSCLPNDSPRGAEVCRKLLSSAAEVWSSDPLERLLHISRPLSSFSRLVFRLFLLSSGVPNPKIPEFCQTLPTYTFLSQAGIEPSTREQHTLDDFISALENGSGVRNQPGPIYWFFVIIFKKLGIYPRPPLLWENGQSNFLVLQPAGICYRWNLHPDQSVMFFIFRRFHPYYYFPYYSGSPESSTCPRSGPLHYPPKR